MSTQIVKFETAQLPAHLRGAELSQADENAVQGISGGTAYPRISIRASRFRLVEDGNETVLDSLHLSTVVVFSNIIAKNFYAGPYDESNVAAPDCWSDDGVKPDISCSSPQNNICATCPNNAWGSGVDQKGNATDGKACSDIKRLAIVSSDDIGGTAYEVQVTPAALKSWAAYARMLRGKKIPVASVKTIVGFDPSASFPKLTFDFDGFLTAEEYEQAKEVGASQLVKDVVRFHPGVTPVPQEDEQPEPVKTASPAAKKAAAAKVAKPAVKMAPEPEVLPPEDEAEDVPEEPAAQPAKGFGKAAAPAKGFGGGKPAAAPAKATGRPPKAAPAADVDAQIAEFEEELNAFSTGQ